MRWRASSRSRATSSAARRVSDADDGSRSTNGAGERLEALAKTTRKPVAWVVETLSYADFGLLLELHATRTLAEQPKGDGGESGGAA